MTRALPLAALLALLLSTSARAAAPDPRRAEAQERFDRGLRLLEKAGDPPGALAEFRRAYDLVPETRTLFMIGIVYGIMNRPVDALAALDQVLREPGSLTAQQQALARTRRAEQAQRVGFLRVATNVPAIIEVDGLEVARTPAPGAIAVAAGTRSVVAISPGHLPARKEATVAGGTTVALSFELAPTDLLAAHIQVTANLPGADLYVDGARAGQTPLAGTLTVAPGSHVVEVRRDGYTPARREITLGSGAAGSLSFELQEDPAATAPRGSLVLAVSEPEAEVSVDGVRRGVYRSPLSLPAGPHRITVMRAGFVPSERVMEVAAVSATTNRVVADADTGDARRVRGPCQGRASLGLDCDGGWGGAGDCGRRAGRRAVGPGPRRARGARRRAGDVPAGRTVLPDGGRRPRDVCQQRLNAANDDVDAHERWRAAGLVGAGVGVAALAVGATLLLTGDDPERYELAGAPAGGRRGDVAFRLGLSGNAAHRVGGGQVLARDYWVTVKRYGRVKLSGTAMVFPTCVLTPVHNPTRT